MNGNNPYAGAPGVTRAGQASAGRELTAGQMDALRRAVTGTVSWTEPYLPEGFAVGSELSTETNGPLATIAVRPPVGHPVSTGFSSDADNLDAGLIDENRNEVVRGFAANAASQVMSAVGDDLTPVAR